VSAAPIVTDLEALNDAQWFAEHPARAFRLHPALGGGWRIVRSRRRDNVFLRTWTPQLAERGPADSDAAIERLWQAAAYPETPP
jgi:hypothetical protein